MPNPLRVAPAPGAPRAGNDAPRPPSVEIAPEPVTPARPPMPRPPIVLFVAIGVGFFFVLATVLYFVTR